MYTADGKAPTQQIDLGLTCVLSYMSDATATNPTRYTAMFVCWYMWAKFV